MSRAMDWRPDYYDNLIAFMADPSDQRTNKQFCADNHIVEETLYQYLRNHGDQVYAEVDSVRIKYIPKIRLAAMRAILANINKSFNDRKLALQLIGDLIERTENVNTNLSPADKRAMIADLLTKLSEKVDPASNKKAEKPKDAV
jgi:hypothetical protein